MSCDGGMASPAVRACYGRVGIGSYKFLGVIARRRRRRRQAALAPGHCPGWPQTHLLPHDDNLLELKSSASI